MSGQMRYQKKKAVVQGFIRWRGFNTFCTLSRASLWGVHKGIKSEINLLNRTNIPRCSAARLLLCVTFLIVIILFSCSKSSEKTGENISVSDQKDSSESADNNTVEAPPEQAEELIVAVPESVVPEQIRRPQQGEAARYPEDNIIGMLGAGEASVESFRYVQDVLQELLREESRQKTLSNLSPEETETIINIFDEIKPAKVRIGGGRREADGSVSFLLRFIGINSWSGGEIYIRQNEDLWMLEDLLLDSPEKQNQGDNSYQFDFPPYERFF